MSQQQQSDVIEKPAGAPNPGTCSTCGQQAPSNGTDNPFVYAIGKIEPRFPNPSIEKEYAQIVARTETKGMTDRQAMRRVLSQRENRYVARHLCWVLVVGGLETYLLVPRDPADLDLLIEALRPDPTPLDVDIVIGSRGPVAPPSLCNGLQVPIVVFDQLYSFDQASLLNAIPRPKDQDHDAFNRAAAELLGRIMQLSDNEGASDSDRALNYLAVRYPAIYAKVAEAFARDFSLSSVIATPSRQNSGRKLMDVIFSFGSRNNDLVEKSFVRVDVTEEFPFLMTKISPYYDH